MLTTLSILLAGIALGAVHALDPDHMMTISSLSAQPRAATMRFAAHWSLGHGVAVLAIAALPLMLDVSLPEALAPVAERCVGIILLAAGLAVLISRRAAARPGPGLRERVPAGIGIVHGAAGSSALLAVLPATLGPPAVGLAYVAVFSIGVLAAMMAFAFCLDRAQTAMAHHLPRLHEFNRLTLGVGAVGMGTYWLHAA